MTTYSNRLTVVIRDDIPMIQCGDSPSYRSVQIDLTLEQMRLLRLHDAEQISRCFLEVANIE